MKSKTFYIVILSIIFFLLMYDINYISAQNIAINSTGTSAAASAMLDITASNKGVLIPRVTLSGTLDATTVPSPATGLMVYNSAAAGSGITAIGTGFYYWNGSLWASIASSQKNEQYALSSTTATLSGYLVWKTFPGLTQTLNLNVGDRVLVTYSGTAYYYTSYSYNQVSLAITSAPAGGPAAGSFVAALTAGGAAGLGKGGTCMVNTDYSGLNYSVYTPFSNTACYDVGTAGSYTFNLYIYSTTSGLVYFGGPTTHVTNTSIIYTVIRK